MAKVAAECLPTLNGFPPTKQCFFSRFLAFQFENVSSHQTRRGADDEALFLLLILLSSQWSVFLPYLSTRPPEAFCHRSRRGKKVSSWSIVVVVPLPISFWALCTSSMGKCAAHDSRAHGSTMGSRRKERKRVLQCVPRPHPKQEPTCSKTSGVKE